MAATILGLYTNDSNVAKNYKYIRWGLVKNTTTNRELKLPNHSLTNHSLLSLFFQIIQDF